MPNENTALKIVTPVGYFNTTDEIVVMNGNTYQHQFLIIAGSLLASLVLIAVACKNGSQHFESSAQEIVEFGGALADYQVDTVNSALTKNIFGLVTAFEIEEGKI